MSLLKKLQTEYVLLDGAMGTQLQAAGLKLGEIPESWNVSHPDRVEAIHRAYIDAGAQVVYANTFGANRYKLDSSERTAELVRAGVAAAKRAAGVGAYVALDIGSIGELIEPLGRVTFDEAYDAFREIIEAGADADLIVIETMTDLKEAKAALLAAKEHSTLPVLVTMTFEENGRTFAGTPVAAAALTLESLGADAIGINCSLGPVQILPLMHEMARYTSLPLAVKANAGLPRDGMVYDVSPEEFAAAVSEYAAMGVHIYGGCCGTTPAYIAAIKEALDQTLFTVRLKKPVTAVCSATRVVDLDGVRIIGERLNPTGKKALKAAYTDGDEEYIAAQAIEQRDGGADILDVNVGIPQADESALMRRVVTLVQSAVDLPLQIDSSSPAAIEAGLRAYVGKPIVNSVNGEEKSLETILPLVKKYGACVVGLALDEHGVPKSADERLKIAKRILDRATQLGIRREDIFIDCLTLTVSAEQAQAKETLAAVSEVKSELGLKTVLGVSNISFGLPYREAVNTAFLTAAMAAGLDMPIMNPNTEAMTAAVRAYRALSGEDADCADYVTRYANHVPVAQTAAAPATAPITSQTASIAPEAPVSPVTAAVLKGMKLEVARLIEELLKTETPLSIVDGELIPALNAVGDAYESGRIFLPQLMKSAEAAQGGFELVRTEIEKSGGTASKGKVILATVKGDVHDIGKNIVKVVMANYGYEILDLGKNTDIDLIVETAIRENVKLVGLSALMTTTVESMRETIAALHAAGWKGKTMVGGAVMTAEYASRIGADYYAKDANESVRIAQKFFHEDR